MTEPRPVSATSVDPLSIDFRASCGRGAQLMVRSRDPGAVELPRGQQEHMLYCSVGTPVDGLPVVSSLQTEQGEWSWQNCPTNHITFVPAGYPMSWDWNYRSSSIHLTLPPGLIDGMAQEIGEPWKAAALRPQFRVFDQHLATLLGELHAEVSLSENGADLSVTSLINLVGVRLLRSAEVSDKAPTESAGATVSAVRLAQAVEYLSDRVGDRVTLEELAQAVGMSPFHFSRSFKKATGLPPHEFHIQLRISRARELLRTRTRLPVAQIAADLGFADENHLRRHFKRVVGMSPAAFRKSR